jgi:DNA-binding NarL/FixJ family response regulator|tara:strand:- start:128 stop:469 length:342 start_codon:yes stop_codon:yes gene_type:complete
MKDTRTKMERYEDLYREAMLKQLKINAEKNPLARGPNKHFVSGMMGAKFGKLGGQSKASVDLSDAPLSGRAKIVNRLLKKRMTQRDIASILDIAATTVSNIKQQYNLPRKEED